MSDHISNSAVVKLSRLLFKKGIPFCLYRFPGDIAYNLAIQKGLLPGKEDTEFIISPFISTTKSDRIFLQKVDTQNISQIFFKELQNLQDRGPLYPQMPIDKSKQDYLQKINHYLEVIRTGKVKKAILSRIKIIKKPQDFDALEFYARLATAYEETFVYLFYIPHKGLWAGATPELLLKKEGKRFHTMALAGTQVRNEAYAYNWRPKEEEEHKMVRQHVESVFRQNLCALIHENGPYNFETGRVVHLRTDYTFEASSTDGLNKIIAGLHPTPAIGGWPVKESQELIKKYESYDRSFYTGYLGEIKQGISARIFINLRCMQIGKDEIALYIGGGISKDSNPEDEWDETNQKSLTLLEIIEESKKEHEVI